MALIYFVWDIHPLPCTGGSRWWVWGEVRIGVGEDDMGVAFSGFGLIVLVLVFTFFFWGLELEGTQAYQST